MYVFSCQVRLLKEGEELQDLLRLPPEQILLRWVNFHLAGSGADRRVTNFGSDLQDGEAYVRLLHQINPVACSLVLLEQTADARARSIVAVSRDMGIPGTNALMQMGYRTPGCIR